MNTGRKQFRATTKIIRRVMSIESKLMNHNDAVIKKAEKGVMKTILRGYSSRHSALLPKEDTGCKAAADKEWDSCQLGENPKYKLRIRLLGKHMMKETRFILLRIWTCVIMNGIGKKRFSKHTNAV